MESGTQKTIMSVNKKSNKKKWHAPREWASVSDKWAHILGFLYENRKRIVDAGLRGECEFQLGGEIFVIKK